MLKAVQQVAVDLLHKLTEPIAPGLAEERPATGPAHPMEGAARKGRRCSLAEAGNGAWALNKAPAALLTRLATLSSISTQTVQWSFAEHKNVWYPYLINQAKPNVLWDLGHGGAKRACQGMEQTYSWQPTNCHVPTWDAHRFCQVLAGRRLVFTGDSVMHQYAMVVMNAVALGGANCSESLFYANSNTLMPIDLPNRTSELPWNVTVATVKPEVVIMNTHAHVWGAERFQQIVRDVAADRERFFPDLALVRVHSPGHLACIVYAASVPCLDRAGHHAILMCYSNAGNAAYLDS